MPARVALNLRESGAVFPCKWCSVAEIYINEHHPNSDETQVEISADKLRNFLEETKKIVEGLGYEIEVEVNE